MRTLHKEGTRLSVIWNGLLFRRGQKVAKSYFFAFFRRFKSLFFSESVKAAFSFGASKLIHLAPLQFVIISPYYNYRRDGARCYYYAPDGRHRGLVT